jgi:hypothetical protein
VVDVGRVRDVVGRLRELWEGRSVYIVPMAAAVFLFVFLIGIHLSQTMRSLLPLIHGLQENQGKSPQQKREHKSNTNAKNHRDEFVSVFFSVPSFVLTCHSP